ncbi:hypothetical protein CIB84_006538 [Bambusicola thoracicus]|uniref:RFX1-4/6/8-like BCD domain-containing protein n=1 Tax=Bambusicola thoracicus TaxID=9083 RepID=A0A2P4T022_BAMTH|nr:hypothetical protein CIB84_006538 [Bambusicola thoracicus]
MLGSKDLHCFPSVTYLKTEEDSLAYILPEFGLVCPWEQELLNKYPYEMVIEIANEYNSHCQDILQVVKMQELDKEIDNILLGDFLKEVSVHYLKSIRIFSKNVKLWLLNALEEFPMPLQTSKCKEVTVFIKRLRRKTDLSNMAKTMRIVLNNNSKVTVLISDLNAVIDQGLLDVPGNLFQKKYGNPDELQYNIEIKCLNDLLSSLAHSRDIRVLLTCVSSNLQAFVLQPSRNKQEFRKVAADFQLRWNFLLSAVSKAMTLNYADSFGK